MVGCRASCGGEAKDGVDGCTDVEYVRVVVDVEALLDGWELDLHTLSMCPFVLHALQMDSKCLHCDRTWLPPQPLHLRLWLPLLCGGRFA